MLIFISKIYYVKDINDKENISSNTGARVYLYFLFLLLSCLYNFCKKIKKN